MAERKRIKPVKGLRVVVPRNCGNCDHIFPEDLEGKCFCERPGGPKWTTGEPSVYFWVCDRYKKGYTVSDMIPLVKTMGNR